MPAKTVSTLLAIALYRTRLARLIAVAAGMLTGLPTSQAQSAITWGQTTGIIGDSGVMNSSSNVGQNNPFTATNGANYNDGDYAVYTGSNDGALPVGSYALASSFYGTSDQVGNVWEWNEAIIAGRGLRGGSWDDRESNLRSSRWDGHFGIAADGDFYIGFRVAAALGGVALVIGLLRRRKGLGPFELQFPLTQKMRTVFNPRPSSPSKGTRPSFPSSSEYPSG
jgi:hypothetical protein